jgi:ADP-heptose:LPS heptosyltransferase
MIARHAVWQGLRMLGLRKLPATPRRILIAHHLLLGDTLMLTPLLAKLRERFPDAEIVLTVPVAIAPLYEHRPYAVTVWPFDPRSTATLKPMFARSGFDLAFVPGDNRHSWLALALGSRWIVAHDGDRPAYKSWPVDQLVSYPPAPAAWGDIVADFIAGPAPAAYRPSDWPAPGCAPFDLPEGPYCVLHLGASSPLKLWDKEKWRGLAQYLAGRGYAIVWSAGRGQEALVTEIDPDGSYRSCAGQLDLPQLWRFIQRSALLVCPDTGVAHLGRIVGTPTVTLFGPGSARIYGPGEFWRDAPYRAVTIEDFPCRDQPIVFKRKIEWVRRCERTTADCAAPACMQAISLDLVCSTVEELLPRT